jgi:uncharacterized damage-inducible protein DinB
MDSWDRNNAILLNLLGAIPLEHWHSRPIESSPSIAQLFAHIHYVRLIFITEDAPEFSLPLPSEEWAAGMDQQSTAAQLQESAGAVRIAVEGRITASRDLERHYDHPLLLLQHMIWHEGYHHGQIKQTLKLVGSPLPDHEIGPLTWGVWMRKTK